MGVSLTSVQLIAVTFLELKPLTAELLPAVLDLDRICFGGLWTLEGYQRELDSSNSDLLVLCLSKAEEQRYGEELHLLPPTHSPPPFLIGIGCLWAILDEAHITILGVHPHYQRQGLGQALFVALLGSAVTRGLERATLEVRASNQRAIALYEKFGFRTAGRRKRYYQDNGEDALILWRSDLHHPNFQQTLADWNHQIGDRLTASGWKLSQNCQFLER